MPSSIERCHPFEIDLDYYRDRARGMLSTLATGERGAIRLVRRYHPGFAGADEATAAAAALDQADAELILAREHGFDDWAAFAAHIGAIASGAVEAPFKAAVDAIKAGDGAGLAALLAARPDLVNARGTNGNRLLTLAVGLQQPLLVDRLLAAKADVDLANNKGWTPLHAAAYADPEADQPVALELLERLLAAGASVDLEAYGAGGTALAVALFWGHRPQAERLARAGVRPPNLRIAAGLGDLGLMASLVGADGRLRPEAGGGREFHRPHSGFPPWRPSPAPQEILDEALVYAAKSSRLAAMAWLLARGADIDGEPYNGTALHWAAARGRAETVEWLLDRGADIDRRAGFGGTHGVTALHVAAGWGGRPAVARLLALRGADLGARDLDYDASPLGWAGHFGNLALRDALAEIGAQRRGGPR